MPKLLSKQKHNDVEALVRRGLSERKISSRVGVSRKTVQNVRKRIIDAPPPPQRGRKSKLSRPDKRKCVRLYTSGECDTVTEVKEALEEEIQLAVSRRTVARALAEFRVKSRRKKKVPMLSKKNIKARLAFARKHQHWGISDWSRVIFSDETKINRYQSDGIQYCLRREGEPINRRHVTETIKGGGGNIKMWGCMTCFGVGFASRIEGNMDAALYKEILADELQQTIEFYNMDPGDLVFQHDNDPKHTSLLVKRYLETCEFEVLDWPSQSPDLNPIEHLWADLKRRLRKCAIHPKNLDELWTTVEKLWEDTPIGTIQNLFKSMPGRCTAVIKARGKWTKY